MRGDAIQALARLGAKNARGPIRSLLRDPTPSVRRASIGALGWLGAVEDILEIERYLDDPDYFVRQDAGHWLSHLGSRKGVPLLLDESHYWPFLNALRRPTEWEHFCARKTSSGFHGTLAQAWEWLAREAGLSLEGAKEDWSSTLIRIPRGTTLEALLEIQQWTGLQVILEPGRVQLVPREEALKFWREWWTKQEKQK